MDCSDWLAFGRMRTSEQELYMHLVPAKSLKTSTEEKGKDRSVQNTLDTQSIFVDSTSDMHSQKTPRNGLSCKMVLQAVGKVLR